MQFNPMMANLIFLAAVTQYYMILQKSFWYGSDTLK